MCTRLYKICLSMLGWILTLNFSQSWKCLPKRGICSKSWLWDFSSLNQNEWWICSKWCERKWWWNACRRASEWWRINRLVYVLRVVVIHSLGDMRRWPIDGRCHVSSSFRGPVSQAVALATWNARYKTPAHIPPIIPSLPPNGSDICPHRCIHCHSDTKWRTNIDIANVSQVGYWRNR